MKNQNTSKSNLSKYDETMRRASEAIDRFHAMLINKDYFGADNYLDEIKPAIIAYYGRSTFNTLQEEMDDALILPF